ncbi:MAG: DUF4922 domain-containing protein [Smithella sp.]
MENEIFAKFPVGVKVKLGELCIKLLEEQKKTWPTLGAAYKGLAEVQIKSLFCNGCKVLVQFNPARSVSSGAAVDQESIKKRACFLCPDNLPCEQKGILYKKKYLILCNPAPIFEKHFTIVHVQHQPQAITGSIESLLDISADLSPDFIVFYNGPACGASAPDHLHFQAVPANVLPLSEIFPDHFGKIENTPVQIYKAEGINRSAVIISGRDKSLLLSKFARLMQAAHNIVAASDEPMINVLCFYKDESWRVIIFFRGKHRPAAFYQEGDRRIFVSPGSIDMAGVIITPLKLDFDRLDCEGISRIYDEVSITEEAVNKIIKTIIDGD